MIKPWTLFVIVLSQFCCTSLWFATNAVMGDLIIEFNLPDSALGHLTSAVQFGFITGTLIFAILTVADRFSPSRVFFICALLGALTNLGAIREQNDFSSLMILRGATGFLLAGIYPVGMKIAADYYQKGLGKSLGFLVGALVVGTGFPHLIKDFSGELNWKLVVILTSAIAMLGGTIMILLVKDGPYRKPGQVVDFATLFKVFRNKKLRAAATGYFGHMWELYAFWAFIPVMLANYQQLHDSNNFNISLISFLVISLGGVACVAGGYLSGTYGLKRIAATALALSGICCLLSPLVFQQSNILVLYMFLVFWGLVVIADSPLFSTLVALNASPETKGTALTMVNCIGFSITIVSLQTMGLVWQHFDTRFIFMILAIGPILGLWGLLAENNEQ